MLATRQIMLRLSFPGEQPTTAAGAVHEWTRLERAQRAVIGLALTWLAAGLFLPFPILHLVMPPGLLLAGPLVALFRGTETRRLVEMRGACPRCKHDRVFQLGLRFNGKRQFTCDGCGNLITLEEA